IPRATRGSTSRERVGPSGYSPTPAAANGIGKGFAESSHCRRPPRPGRESNSHPGERPEDVLPRKGGSGQMLKRNSQASARRRRCAVFTVGAVAVVRRNGFDQDGWAAFATVPVRNPRRQLGGKKLARPGCAGYIPRARDRPHLGGLAVTRGLAALLGILPLVALPWSAGQGQGGDGPAAVTNSIGMKLVRIPVGATFAFGSPSDEYDRNDDEGSLSARLSKPFYLGCTEVTQAEYARVTGKNPSWFSA